MTLEFGPSWQDDFTSSPYSLRFELGYVSQHPNNYVTRFLGSLERARILAKAALPSTPLMAVIAAMPQPELAIDAEQHGWIKGASGFDHLAQLGVVTDSPLAAFNDHFWPLDRDDPEAETWEHRVISITWREAEILLWNQIAADLGVGPQAPVQSKLVDPARGVLVHAYDDRGMDVTSLGASATQGLYRSHKAWLLDYDRPRMAEVFEG